MTKIADFLGKFDGGSRPNLFEIEITGESSIFGPDDLKVHCKAAALPSSVLGEIPINYMGRIIKVPGDRTYEDWTITIINDEQMSLRHKFEEWNSRYNNHQGNTPSVNIAGANKQNSHMTMLATTSAIVRQLDRNHKMIREYTLNGLWCDNVSAVDLSYDTPDSISEFTVTLKYQYFTIQKGTSGTIIT